MGGVVSGVLGPIASFLGTCVGSCCAAGCCKLMTLGSTDTRQAATFLLVWLQAISAVIALVMGTWTEWLNWPCSKIMDAQKLFHGDTSSILEKLFFDRASASAGGSEPDPIGVCASVLRSASDASPSDAVGFQVVHRTEAAAFTVFFLILALCLSGCGASAARSVPLLKLVGMMLLAFVFLFLPNGIFTAFGATAGVASFFFLTAQSIICIDVAYSANEAIYTQAVNAQRGANLARSRAWKGGLIGGSATLVCLSVAWCYWLCTVYSQTALRIVIPAMVVAILFLLVSITDWCEQGSLFASAIYMANIAWLSYEAMAGLEGPVLSHLTGVAVCGFWLVVFACSTWLSTEQRTLPLAENSSASGSAVEDVQITTAEFAKQSAVHAAASVYIASELAPYIGKATFVARVVALGASLALYGWSLVAPRVLRYRDF